MHPASASGELWVCHLGTIEYRRALEAQTHVRARRQADEIPDTLLLLEHPPVYTRGRRSQDGELPMGEDFYRARGIEIVEVDRGGRAHLPRPRSARRLPDHAHRRRHRLPAHDRARDRRRARRRAVSRARRARGPTGVWVGERKIASIGVHVSRRVTTHGFAVNVDNDLEPFEWIVPCGLDGVTMTSVARERGERVGARRLPHRRRASASRGPRAARARHVAPAAGSACADLAAAPDGGGGDERRRATRSRANPGGMDVPKVLGTDVGAARAQAAVVQGAAARRAALPRADRADRRARTCTPSARRPPARTSASAGSAAPRPS